MHAQAPAATPSRQEWLAGEDALLARALLRFGVADSAKHRTYFLPVRSEEDIAARIRKKTGQRSRDNPVKVLHCGCSRTTRMAWLLS